MGILLKIYSNVFKYYKFKLTKEDLFKVQLVSEKLSQSKIL